MGIVNYIQGLSENPAVYLTYNFCYKLSRILKTINTSSQKYNELYITNKKTTVTYIAANRLILEYTPSINLY